MTMGERVGSVFSLALGLHNPELAHIFHSGHQRQRNIYQSFPTLNQDSLIFYEQYIHPMTVEECRDTLVHLKRHGVDISMMEMMDWFQVNQLLYRTTRVLDKTVYPDSYPEFSKVGSIYVDKGNKVIVEQRFMNQIQTAVNGNVSQMFKKHRNITVDDVVPKHHRKKEKQKVDDSTCAFLGQNVSSLISLLEYALCCHAFCKYSSSLPPSIRRDFDLMEFSGRSLLTYFSKMLYQGDNQSIPGLPKFMHSEGLDITSMPWVM